MPEVYSIEKATAAAAGQALPLLYGPSPRLALARWRAFCEGRSAAATDRKVLLARNEAGYVQGLCAFFLINHQQFGAVIDAPIFIVASAADPHGVADELLAALLSECRREGCAGVTIGLKELDCDLRRRLARQGTLVSENSLYVGVGSAAQECSRVVC
jgi:hypothetical protein